MKKSVILKKLRTIVYNIFKTRKLATVYYVFVGKLLSLADTPKLRYADVRLIK